MIEMSIPEFGILLFLAWCGAFCLIYGIKLKIKEKKIRKRLVKGGLIPLGENVNLIAGGYQPTESTATQPPDKGSGVQPAPPKSGTNAQKINFPCYDKRVFISPETAMKILKKKSIPRLRMLLTPLKVNSEEYYSVGNDKKRVITLFRCPACDAHLRRRKKRCFNCSQALDWEGVSENG